MNKPDPRELFDDSIRILRGQADGFRRDHGKTLREITEIVGLHIGTDISCARRFNVGPWDERRCLMLERAAHLQLPFGLWSLRSVQALIQQVAKIEMPIRTVCEYLRWWETATPLYRAGVCEKAGVWTHLRLEEDWEYHCRIASLGGRLTYCPIPVSEHRDHVGERLSRGNAKDPTRLRQRAAAESLIFQHALAYGLTPEFPEMQQFSRSLFLLARQCGAAGLADEAKSLFALACGAAGDVRAKGLDFRIFALLARLIGWVALGKLSNSLDLLRRGDA